MKKTLFALVLLLHTLLTAAQEKSLIIPLTSAHKAAVALSTIDSIYFSSDAAYMCIACNGSVTRVSLASLAGEMTYATLPSALTITFSGESATVVNPYFLSGVTVTTDGAHVSVTNSNVTNAITTELSGATDNGSFTYNGNLTTTINLNGVSINNPKGAAIDIECGKTVSLNLIKGTVNTLSDGSDGSQKAALYCKGHLEIDKAGTLNVAGNTKHAIAAKEYIQLKKSSGKINITSAKSDGFHCGQYFLANGYEVNISGVAGDGIQAEMENIKNGEVYEENMPNGSVTIQGGKFTITTQGDSVACIKADGRVTINEAKSTPQLYLNALGVKGRGISADSCVNIVAGVVEIKANHDGGVEAVQQTGETQKSYTVYVAKTVGTSGGWGGNQGSSAWSNIYLYKADGTLVKQLTQTKSITGTNGQTLTFYYYDFGAADEGKYYFKSDNYTSMSRPGSTGNTYSIVSSEFTGPTSGIDYYYQISSNYTTSGSTRTYSLSSVQAIYGGGGDSESQGETYSSMCIKSDTEVTLTGGTLALECLGTMGKGIKASSVNMIGTDVTATLCGDMHLSGTDASYCAGVKTDNYNGTGGSLTINASSGKAIRGISANKSIEISGGQYKMTSSSNGYLGTNDAYTAKGITCDGAIVISGGTLDIAMSGTGGKCIKSDAELTIGDSSTKTGPTMTLATTGAMLGQASGGFGKASNSASVNSSSKAIKAIGAVNVWGGYIKVTTTTSGAEGLESKTNVKISGGEHYFKCYDDCINSAGVIEFAGGTTACYSYGNDAVDSNYGRSGAITISGGNIFAYTTKGTPEEGLDCDNNSYITVTGGIAVSAGGVQGGGGGSSIGSSTQGYYLGSSPQSYSTSYYYTLCNTSGNAVCTYRFEGNCSNSLSLLTAPNLGKGSVTVKYGTAAPTACDASVANGSGTAVFFINPTVTTTGISTTVTAK